MEAQRTLRQLPVDDPQQGELRHAAGLGTDHHGHRQQDHEQRHLVGQHEQHLAREAHRAEGRAGGRTAQHHGDGRYGQQVEEHQQVAHIVQTAEDPGDGDEGRADGHTRKPHHRRGQEDALAGRAGDEGLLGAELGDVQPGLEERRPHAALQAGFHTAVEGLVEEPQRQREESAGKEGHVQDGVQGLAHASCSLLARSPCAGSGAPGICPSRRTRPP